MPAAVHVEVGAVYGEWTVLSFAGSQKGQRMFLCRCSCGTERVITASRVISTKYAKCCKNCANRHKSYARAHYDDGENVIGHYLARVEIGAKSRNIPCSLTMQDLEDQWSAQNGKCALSGRQLTLKSYSKDYKATASVDRIDSTQGYTPENVQFVHKDINKMKLNHNESYFFELCRDVVEYKQETVKLRGSRPWRKDS